MRDSRYAYPDEVYGGEHPNYSLEKATRYRVTNRITKQTYQASALSADEACKKLGWLIGNCFVEELGLG